MGLFGAKKQAEPRQFVLPSDLRADLRKVFDSAPLSGRDVLRSAAGEPALRSLNARLPQDETVSAIVYCMDPMKGYGYLVLTDRRVVLTLGKDGRSPSALAVPLAEIAQFVFDGGVAACTYGAGDTFTVAFSARRELLHGGV
jgi:hypothetical protein